MFKSRLLPVALIAAALALSSCGSDNESSSSGASESGATATNTGTTSGTTTTKPGGGSDKDQVTQVIKSTFTTNENSNCTELETSHFVQQIYFGMSIANSVGICQLGTPALPAGSVTISKLEIKPDKATAELAVKGGFYDGQVLAITLVKDGGQWKMDSVDRIIDFDASHFAVAFAKTHHEAGDLKAHQVACVTHSLESVSPDVLEKVMLAGQPHPLGRIFRHCIVKGLKDQGFKGDSTQG